MRLLGRLDQHRLDPAAFFRHTDTTRGGQVGFVRKPDASYEDRLRFVFEWS